ncbi:MAG: metallophosphoesterase [Alphaproteobacteria bacterium]|nr:metallophosphoesterase [Alphaproteobacteria bacterium]
MTALRLCLVADIHHGEDNFTKKASAALPLMAEFARFANDARPDAVIDLGDRISDIDAETDLRLERDVAEAFKAVDAPVLHICGNHDRDHLSVADNAEILGQDLSNQTIDVGDWTLVLWRADSKIHRPGGFVMPESDLLWLAGVVRTAIRPLAIFSHVPISGHAQTGNYYFERNPDASTYPGAAGRARAILATARVPVVTIAGHVHWNTLTIIDGQPHFTVQSLTESFTTAPEPAGAFALLELDEHIDLRVFGKDTFAARLSAEETTRRWIAPLPPFHEHPEIRLRMQAQQAAE